MKLLSEALTWVGIAGILWCLGLSAWLSLAAVTAAFAVYHHKQGELQPCRIKPN